MITTGGAGIGILYEACKLIDAALWDFERQYGHLPAGREGEEAQLKEIAEGLRVELGVNEKVMPKVDDESIE